MIKEMINSRLGSPVYRFSVYSVISTLVFLAFILQFQRKVELDKGAIVIEMMSNADGSVNLWVNDQSKKPITLNLIRNVRKLYRFEGVSERNITLLRIDPLAGISNQVVSIYSVKLEGTTGEIIDVPLQDIAAWKVYGAQSVNWVNDRVEYLTGIHTILVSERKYEIPLFFSSYLHKFNYFFAESDSFFVLYSFLFFGLLLFVGKFERFATFGVLCCNIFLLILVYGQTSRADIGSIFVGQAVSHSAYVGKSIFPNQLFLFVALAIATVVAIIFYKLKKAALLSSSDSELNVTASSAIRSWQISVLIVLLSIYHLPDINNLVPRLVMVWDNIYVRNWDSDNSVVWSYMINKGLMPFKDFWYPYAFTYLYEYAQPFGSLLRFTILTVLVSAIFHLFRIITRGTLLLPSIMVCVLIAGSAQIKNTVFFPQLDRHLLPYAIALSYLIGSRLQGSSKNLALFWGLTCLAILLEPSQLLYVVPSIIFVILANLFDFKKINLVDTLKNLLVDFSIPVIFMIGLIAIFMYAGVFGNIYDFYLKLNVVSQYMVIPTDLSINIENIDNFSFWLVLMPFVLLSVGLYQYLTSDNASKIICKSIVVVSLIGIVQLQKHIVRPINYTLLYSSFIGSVLVITLLLKKGSISNKLLLSVGMYAGILVAVLTSYGLVDQFLGKSFSLPARVTNLLAIFDSPSQLIEKSRKQLFSKSKFSGYADEIKLVEYLNSNSPAGYKLYVLPDNPVPYVLAGVKPPYQINGFSMSPIFEQVKMVEYLNGNNIDYIALRPGDGIDAFAYPVRLPILYKYIVNNYRLLDNLEVSPYVLAEKYKQMNFSDLVKWKSSLGSTVDLGYIPAYSKDQIVEVRTCIQDCRQFLKLNLDDSSGIQNVKIKVIINAEEFFVSFNTVKYKSLYYVNTERLWFWPNSNIPNDQILVTTNNVKNSIQIITSLENKNGEVLY